MIYLLENFKYFWHKGIINISDHRQLVRFGHFMVYTYIETIHCIIHSICIYVYILLFKWDAWNVEKNMKSSQVYAASASIFLLLWPNTWIKKQHTGKVYFCLWFEGSVHHQEEDMRALSCGFLFISSIIVCTPLEAWFVLDYYYCPWSKWFWIPTSKPTTIFISVKQYFH